MVDAKKELINKLRENILQWEGYKAPPVNADEKFGLGAIEASFPNNTFPVGTVHEIICNDTEQATACIGFISGLLSVLMQNEGVCLWISLSGNVFPIALKSFGIEPDKIIFVNLKKDKDVLWVMEEALKCIGLAAVIGELSEFDFKQSRRLQLAVEQSHVTGFILRNYSKKLGSTACAARWQITQLPSEPIDELPGLGFPRWQVKLLKARNGKPGNWIIEWADGKFSLIKKEILEQQIQSAG
jgi:protein ImuA